MENKQEEKLTNALNQIKEQFGEDSLANLAMKVPSKKTQETLDKNRLQHDKQTAQAVTSATAQEQNHKSSEINK
ncbi:MULTISPECIES: hypothetical protein [unclassified Colwellia]|jgi:hypothetical protein|uniref:hypothetical protein n=1 Tax=unclassified Colwellia TaxID=196834 RepID=UPI0015F54755|nr:MULTISPECIES: hypothetical protein [unclassified Colwellia]MBA6379695.1 hypothetical protein [Colwellia sp. BRX10-7]MBA6388490.1 hypothetical protein [Colwellia sp. BRX10-2]MBA6402996.1 hypothetical protein [Colwellia sp. BRX10-5]MBA6406313.1 hypothetical protein [Colwellia sp. BRX10-1]